MARTCLILGLFLGLFLPRLAYAYPEFIGYKYGSCLTCHYNGHGNGPISDYGRALWSAEIAGRLFSGNKTSEQLGETSGFLGKTDNLPWWFRPGVKTRYLYYQTQPGSATSQSRSIVMQADVNAAVFLDQDQKYIFVGSLGYAPTPQRLQNSTTPTSTDNLISREHYFGMLDKVYGIRTIDHTAYSRSRTGLAQNDQAHSIIAQYIQPNYEASLDIFAGNLFQDAELRQKGFSTMFDYELRPAWRVGFSFLKSSDDYIGNQRFALHTRYGFGYGSALLFEIGNIKDTPQNGAAKNGYYIYSELIQKVARGYHVFLTGQAYKDDMVASRPDNIKLEVGLLAFPLARVETRLEVANTRQIYAGPQAPPDAWAILLQLHLSL
jgi:hypothetical protein